MEFFVLEKLLLTTLINEVMKLIKLVLLSFLFICTYSYASVHSEPSISIEFNSDEKIGIDDGFFTVSGTIRFLKEVDCEKLQSSFKLVFPERINKNTTFLSIGSQNLNLKSAGKYLKDEIISFDIDINFNKNEIPNRLINARFVIDQDGRKYSVPMNVYITPYNTIEIWNDYDFGRLLRRWTTEEVEEVEIERSNIPESNLTFEELLDETIEKKWYSVRGLPYSIPVKSTKSIFDDVLYGDCGSDPHFVQWDADFNLNLQSLALNDDDILNYIDIEGIKVTVYERDEFPNPDDMLLSFYTDENGNCPYDNISTCQRIIGGIADVFEESDLSLELYVVIEARNPSGDIEVVYSSGNVRTIEFTGGGLYTWDIVEHSIDINYQLNILDAVIIKPQLLNWANKAMEFVNSSHAGVGFVMPANSNKILKIYSSVDGTGLYEHADWNHDDRIWIPLDIDHEFDEDLLYHEYGHYLKWYLSGEACPSTELIWIGHNPGENCQNEKVAFNEGWANGFSAIMDFVSHNEDNESGFYSNTDYRDLLYRSPPRTFFSRTNNGVHTNTNGIVSEFAIGAFILDLWDNQGVADLYGVPNDISDGGLDNIGLNFASLTQPFRTHQGTGENSSAVIQDVVHYTRVLRNQLSNCDEVKNLIDLTIVDRLQPFDSEMPEPPVISGDLIEFETVMDFVYFGDVLPTGGLEQFAAGFNLWQNLNLIDNNSLSFNLGLLNINSGSVLVSDNLAISGQGGNNGILYINAGMPSGIISNGGPHPIAGSHIDANVCADIITIDSGGEISIGDDYSANTADIFIEDGTLLNVLTEGVININNGCNLVIKSGGTLYLHDQAELNFSGSGKLIVESGGFICIDDGAIMNNVTQNSIDLHNNSILGTNPSWLVEAPTICSYYACNELHVINYSGTTNVTSGTWDSEDLNIDGELLIGPGNTLIIKNSTLKFTENSKIIIRETAKLVIDNSILTSIGDCMLWDGILVEGDDSRTQSPTSNQGVIEIVNGTLISNAKCAVKSLDGGIVLARESTFRDNLIGVSIKSYHNSTNSISSLKIDNVSRIYKCSFETTDHLAQLQYNPESFIELIVVEGVDIIGNTFINSNQYNYLYNRRGIGVYCLYAAMDLNSSCSEVIPYGTNCPDEFQTKNTFTNLYCGIQLLNNAQFKTTTIKNANFTNNSKGIDIAYHDYAVITDNQLNIPNFTYGDFEAYGIWVESSHGFEIERNNSYSNNGGRVGVIFEHVSGNTDELYGNRYNGLQKAIVAKNGNTGLKIHCNKMENTILGDIWVKDGNISLFQGTSTNPAGNQFSYSSAQNSFPYSDIYFEGYGGYNNIYYYRWNDQVYNTDLVYYQSNRVTELPNSPTMTFDPDIHCPEHWSKLSNGGLIEKLSQLKSAANDLESLIDGNDTQGSLEAVQDMSPGKLKNYLLNNAPYVSDEVLISAIESGLPSGILMEILVANSPLTPDVQEALEEIVSSLPGGIADNIEENQDGISPLIELNSEIFSLQSERELVKNELIRNYLTDSISHLDSIIYILEEETDTLSKMQLVYWYLDQGECLAADSILQQFVISNQEDQDYYDLAKVFVDLCTNSETVEDLDSNQLELLFEIIENETSIGGQAEAISTMITGEDFPDILPPDVWPDEATIAGIIVENEDCGGDPVEGAELTLYDENGEHVDNITPVMSDSEGYFSFDLGELQALDSLSLFTIGTVNDYSIFNKEYLTIQEWIQKFDLTLSFDNVDNYWYDTYNGIDSLFDIGTTVDLEGNIYVGGQSRNIDYSYDFVVIKYTPLGEREWVTIIPGASTSRDAKIVSDSDGNCYITGATIISNEGYNILLSKVDPSGNIIWTDLYNGSANNTDTPTDIEVDSENNIYITGRTTGNLTGEDIITIKYDGNGNRLWIRTYNSDASQYDQGSSLQIDNLGNVIVGGVANKGLESNYIVLKYDNEGNLLLVFEHDDNGSEVLKEIAIDNDNNIYCTGYNNFGFLNLKYSETGTLIWEHLLQGTGGSTDQGENIIVSDDGFVYVSGNLDDHIAIIKYDLDGNYYWNTSYQGSLGGRDFVNAMVLDNEGNAFVTGRSCPTGITKDSDIATFKVNNAGEIEWTQLFNLGYGSQNIGNDIAVSENGNVYVTGHAYNGTDFDLTTIKYSQCYSAAHLKSLELSNDENVIPLLNTFKLYPNPNDGSMTIEYSLDYEEGANLVFCNIQGVEVCSFKLSANSNIAWINSNELEDGLYFYKLFSRDNLLIRGKVIIVK